MKPIPSWSHAYIANRPMLDTAIGFVGPVPNMRANARSFMTLKLILAIELPSNLGYNGLASSLSQIASIEFATIRSRKYSPDE